MYREMLAAAMFHVIRSFWKIISGVRGNAEMRLSMWVLLDELEGFHTESAILDGARVIDGFRAFSSEESVSRGSVYIGRCADFFGTEADSVLLAHGRDMILVRHADFTDILNRMIAVFDKYRDWDRRICAACADPNPFQAVMDVAHEVIESPMFFGQNNMRIFAITRQYSSEQVYEEWDMVKSLYTIPVRLIERLKVFNIPAMYPDELDPAVMPVSDTMPEARNYRFTIRTNCYLNGRIWGHLFVYYTKDRVSKSVTQFTRYLADVYEKLLHSSHEYDTERYSRFSILSNLLDGAAVSEGNISNLYSILGWNETTPLVLYKITPSPQAFDKLLFNWMCKSLSERFPNTVIFPYQNTIVLVASRLSNEAQTLAPAISQLLSVGYYQCGTSLPFCGLEKLASFYEQAGCATETEADSPQKIHYFEECTYACLAKAFRAHLNWRDWILPSLFRLMETDALQGTEYFKTLYCLLINRGHFGNTAKGLYIHRNTLTYRLSRIENLLGVDIYDERIFAYLRFCYELMEAGGLDTCGTPQPAAKP
jgi:hypothetical protein